MLVNHPGRFHRPTARAATIRLAMLAAAGVLLASCGGGGGGSTDTTTGGGGNPPPQTYTIGGSVSGLTGSGLVLQDNGGNNLSVSAGAKSFTFSTPLNSGTNYSVTVLTQPTNPAQTCAVTNGSGTASANVTSVTVACTTNVVAQYTIGGKVAGLTGKGLVLQDNGGNNLSVAANSTSFTFSSAINSGSGYAVTVLTQPSTPSQTCTVTNGSGTVNGANVTNVQVTCTTSSYTVGGTVSGLVGSGLVLQDNNGNNLAVSPAVGSKTTPFTFTVSITSGGNYAVSILTQPSAPTQICNVTNGSGTVTSANVTTVAVSCASVGRFVFVANTSDGANGDVWAYTINSSTGVLTAVSGNPFLADISPNGAAVDTSGQFVYVSNGASLDVSIFTLDQSTGALTQTTHSPVDSTGSKPRSIVVDPSDSYVFTAGQGTADPGTIFDYTLNVATGFITAVQPQPIGVPYAQQSIAVDPTSQFVFTTAGSHFLFVSQIGTGGTLTVLANAPFRTSPNTDNPYGVAVWPNGTANGGYVYTANPGNGNITGFSYDSTGNATVVGTYNAGNNTHGIAIDPTGKFLYATNVNDDTVSAYTIDAQSGALNTLGTYAITKKVNGAATAGPIDVKIDPSSQFLYTVNSVDGSVSLFTVASNGTLTFVDTYPSGTDGAGSGATALTVY